MSLKKVDSNKQQKATIMGNKKIIRTYSAGVFYGEVESREGKEGVITNARCLWYWEGAASLLQLALEGTSKKEACKFTVIVPRIELTEIIEILDVTAKAQQNLDEVPVWKI